MPIQPIKNFDELPAESLTKMAENIQKMPPPSGGKSFCPFIFGNDVDSVDIALRVAMVGKLKILIVKIVIPDVKAKQKQMKIFFFFRSDFLTHPTC